MSDPLQGALDAWGGAPGRGVDAAFLQDVGFGGPPRHLPVATDAAITRSRPDEDEDDDDPDAYTFANMAAAAAMPAGPSNGEAGGSRSAIPPLVAGSMSINFGSFDIGARDDKPSSTAAGGAPGVPSWAFGVTSGEAPSTTSNRFTITASQAGGVHAGEMPPAAVVSLTSTTAGSTLEEDDDDESEDGDDSPVGPAGDATVSPGAGGGTSSPEGDGTKPKRRRHRGSRGGQRVAERKLAKLARAAQAAAAQQAAAVASMSQQQPILAVIGPDGRITPVVPNAAMMGYPAPPPGGHHHLMSLPGGGQQPYPGGPMVGAPMPFLGFAPSTPPPNLPGGPPQHMPQHHMFIGGGGGAPILMTAAPQSGSPAGTVLHHPQDPSLGQFSHALPPQAYYFAPQQGAGNMMQLQPMGSPSPVLFPTTSSPNGSSTHSMAQNAGGRGAAGGSASGSPLNNNNPAAVTSPHVRGGSTGNPPLGPSSTPGLVGKPPSPLIFAGPGQPPNLGAGGQFYHHVAQQQHGTMVFQQPPSSSGSPPQQVRLPTPTGHHQQGPTLFFVSGDRVTPVLPQPTPHLAFMPSQQQAASGSSGPSSANAESQSQPAPPVTATAPPGGYYQGGAPMLLPMAMLGNPGQGGILPQQQGAASFAPYHAAPASHVASVVFQHQQQHAPLAARAAGGGSGSTPPPTPPSSTAPPTATTSVRIGGHYAPLLGPGGAGRSLPSITVGGQPIPTGGAAAASTAAVPISAAPAGFAIQA